MGWIYPLAPIGWTAEPRKKQKSRTNRSEKARKISQQTLLQLRAEYATLPCGPGGCHRKGTVATLIAKYGISRTYFWRLVTGGIRDEEREP